MKKRYAEEQIIEQSNIVKLALKLMIFAERWIYRQALFITCAVNMRAWK